MILFSGIAQKLYVVLKIRLFAMDFIKNFSRLISHVGLGCQLTKRL